VAAKRQLGRKTWVDFEIALKHISSYGS